jgi:hypothetical protein
MKVCLLGSPDDGAAGGGPGHRECESPGQCPDYGGHQAANQGAARDCGVAAWGRPKRVLIIMRAVLGPCSRPPPPRHTFMMRTLLGICARPQPLEANFHDESVAPARCAGDRLS